MVKVNILLVVFFWLIVHINSAIAQTTQTLVADSTYFPREWEWTEEEWTGSDASYLRIRQVVDNVVARKQDINALTRRYAKIAASKPSDPEAQFAWGYAAVLARKPGTYVGRKLPNAISKALAAVHSPHSYQYARVRYLMLLTWGTWSQLKNSGKRLLAKNPNDWPVKRHLIRLLASGTIAERQQALVYANQVVTKYPDLAFSYGNMGDVYRRIFYDENKIDAGYKAITAYEKSLTLDSNPEGKEDAKYLIAIIQKRIKKLQR